MAEIVKWGIAAEQALRFRACKPVDENGQR